MAEELREVGVPIDDCDLCLTAMNGLDELYDLIITAESARMEDITIAAFLGLLCAYEKCHLWSGETKIDLANIAQRVPHVV